MLIAQIPTSINVIMPAAAEQISCQAVDQMLRKGYENPVKEVANVQKVLRDIERMDVAVTGDFDDATESAVMDFQKKYSSDILGPWGASRATGIVSLTTGKKINQLACSVPLTLDPKEMRFIDIVRSKAEQADSETADALGASQSALVPGSKAPGDAAAYPYDDMTASVSGSSMASKFGRYLMGLFR